MKKTLLLATLVCCSMAVIGQQYDFQDDALERGWYNRPYQRYEAEPDLCTTNGTFLEATDNQRMLASEASHQQALQLVKQNDYVSWQVAPALLKVGDAEKTQNEGIQTEANIGVTIRFSLPDAEEGTGTIGNMRLELIGNENDIIVTTDLSINSYWAWQYTARNGNYPDNTPDESKMVRMRFDEMHVLLEGINIRNAESQGDTGDAGDTLAGVSTAGVSMQYTLRLTKIDDNDIPYTIDFAEVEVVPNATTADDITDDNLVIYHANTDGDIADFIQKNGGKTIYIPAGRFETAKRIYLRTQNTHIIGAGEWWTEIYFTASSDDRSTYSNRGIECSASNCSATGFYINTINNKRYYNNNDSYQVGKGFMGSWGKGSKISNCWVEHFECGAWIASYGDGWSEDLTVEYCRFRNNYADGINFSQRCRRNTCRYCSFRNNGDDDMASWTTSSNMNTGCTFAYCTAENNWRASSLGFFGGEMHEAHHIAIYDALECGVRVNADFGGKGFSTNGNIVIHDISIYHSGCKGGTWGQAGDFWGNMQGALNIGGTSNYPIQNIIFRQIDIIDTRSNAIYMRAGSGKKLLNIVLEDITINGAAQYGIYYSGAQGNARYCRVNISNCQTAENTHMPSFVITDSCDADAALDDVQDGVRHSRKYIRQGHLYIENNGTVYNSLGQKTIDN